MKLGVGVLYNTDAALALAEVAPIVTTIDSRQALAIATNAPVKIFRHYFATQDIDRPGGDVAADVLAALGTGVATHVCLFNEVAQTLDENLERHVAMTREAVAFMRQVRPDLKILGYRFSTGNPGQADWEYLKAQNYGDVDVIGLNQYWGNQGFTQEHALRHRQADTWTAGDHPDFVITECGRDRIEGGKGGWRADGLNYTTYSQELIAYDTEISQDAYVLGATIFTAGAQFDAQPQAWTPFDLDPISDQLLNDPNSPLYNPIVLSPYHGGTSPIDTLIASQGGSGLGTNVGIIGGRGFLTSQWGPFPAGTEYVLAQSGVYLSTPDMQFLYHLANMPWITPFV